MSNSRPPFALLIAINRYMTDTYDDLDSTINDATAVNSYVQKYLGATPSRIRTLYDSSATRQAIINELQYLASSEDIEKGDPIIIFYAGHGCELDAPAGWDSSGNVIQAILPHDFDEDDPDTALPDRTIGALLEKIANEKGDNITLIFDCCHSGSMTRGEATASRGRIRGVGKLKGAMSPQVDENIWAHHVGHGRGRGPAEGFLNSGLGSHVLLSACGAKEQAREYEQGGAFTSALLKTLSTVGHDKVTYTELIDRLPSLPGQNPHCEGHNRRRICFDSKAPVPKRAWFRVKAGLQNSRLYYAIEAGTAHGITDGAKFAVYSSKTPRADADPLAYVTASAVYPYRCIVKVVSGTLDTDLAQAAAIQTHTGTQEDLRLYIPVDARENTHLNTVYKAIEALGDVQVGETNSAAPLRIVHTKKRKAELGVFLNGTDLMVEILDPIITVHGLKQLQGSIPAQLPMTTFFLQGAAHYHRYLHRIRGNRQKSAFLDQIKVEFTQLMRQGDFFQPVGENLIKAGVVDIPAGVSVMYGIKIINKSDKDLFPSVFLFNALDLSIDSIYECSAAKSGKLDCPLPARGGCLTIGYGSGGSRPMFFYLENGQDIDISLLKIFISDRYVDMGNVAQGSPFDASSSNVAKRNWRMSFLPKDDEGTWVTALVSVIQRRPI